MAGKDFKVKRGVLSRLPAWLKAALIKAWFGGAVFYFIGWGLFIPDQLDLTIALGLALGLVTDLLINRALVFLESGAMEYRRFILYYSKRFYAVPVNLVYGILLSFCVAYTYHGLNLLAIQWGVAAPGQVALGGEPILYGLFFMGYDMLFVAIKGGIAALVRRKET